MIDPELLSILVCPVTHQPVRVADEGLLADLLGRLQAGTLQTVEGKKVEETFEGGLLREDGLVLYPIRQGIPVMLIDEGITVKAVIAES